MANRDMSVAVLSEIAKNSIVMYDLVEAIFPDFTIRNTNGMWDVVYEGNTFKAFGPYMGVSPITEDANFEINEVSITLSAIDPVVFSRLNDTPIVNQRISIWRQLWNGVDGVVGTFQTFSGRFNRAEVSKNGDSLTISCRASNQFVDFEAISGRNTNEESHQFHFPGDRFFQYANEVIREFRWERPPSGVN